MEVDSGSDADDGPAATQSLLHISLRPLPPPSDGEDSEGSSVAPDPTTARDQRRLRPRPASPAHRKRARRGHPAPSDPFLALLLAPAPPSPPAASPVESITPISAAVPGPDQRRLAQLIRAHILLPSHSHSRHHLSLPASPPALAAALAAALPSTPAQRPRWAAVAAACIAGTPLLADALVPALATQAGAAAELLRRAPAFACAFGRRDAERVDPPLATSLLALADSPPLLEQTAAPLLARLSLAALRALLLSPRLPAAPLGRLLHMLHAGGSPHAAVLRAECLQAHLHRPSPLPTSTPRPSPLAGELAARDPSSVCAAVEAALAALPPADDGLQHCALLLRAADLLAPPALDARPLLARLAAQRPAVALELAALLPAAAAAYAVCFQHAPDRALLEALSRRVPSASAAQLQLQAALAQQHLTERTARAHLHDYLVLVRTRLQDMGQQLEGADAVISAAAQSSPTSAHTTTNEADSKALGDVRKALAAFAETRRVPHFLLEWSIFRAHYFKRSIVPMLVTFDEASLAALGPDLEHSRADLVRELEHMGKIPEPVARVFDSQWQALQAARRSEGADDSEAAQHTAAAEPSAQQHTAPEHHLAAAVDRLTHGAATDAAWRELDRAVARLPAAATSAAALLDHYVRLWRGDPELGQLWAGRLAAQMSAAAAADMRPLFRALAVAVQQRVQAEARRPWPPQQPVSIDALAALAAVLAAAPAAAASDDGWWELAVFGAAGQGRERAPLALRWGVAALAAILPLRPAPPVFFPLVESTWFLTHALEEDEEEEEEDEGEQEGHEGKGNSSNKVLTMTLRAAQQLLESPAAAHVVARCVRRSALLPAAALRFALWSTGTQRLWLATLSTDRQAAALAALHAVYAGNPHLSSPAATGLLSLLSDGPAGTASLPLLASLAQLPPAQATWVARRVLPLWPAGTLAPRSADEARALDVFANNLLTDDPDAAGMLGLQLVGALAAAAPEPKWLTPHLRECLLRACPAFGCPGTDLRTWTRAVEGCLPALPRLAEALTACCTGVGDDHAGVDRAVAGSGLDAQGLARCALALLDAKDWEAATEMATEAEAEAEAEVETDITTVVAAAAQLADTLALAGGDAVFGTASSAAEIEFVRLLLAHLGTLWLAGEVGGVPTKSPWVAAAAGAATRAGAAALRSFARPPDVRVEGEKSDGAGPHSQAALGFVLVVAHTRDLAVQCAARLEELHEALAVQYIQVLLSSEHIPVDVLDAACAAVVDVMRRDGGTVAALSLQTQRALDELDPALRFQLALQPLQY